VSPHQYELRANIDSADACARQLCAEDVSPVDRRMLADQLQHDLAEVRRLLPITEVERG
jgi:hypothetical protein